MKAPRYFAGREISSDEVLATARSILAHLSHYSRHAVRGVFLKRRGESIEVHYCSAVEPEFDLSARDCRLIWVGTYNGGTDVGASKVTEDLLVAIDACAERRYG